MQYSAEMRWFPDSETGLGSILSWFKKQGKDFTGNVRTDLYLLIKNRFTHGIKLREGKLEIKVIYHDWGEMVINDNTKGKASMWCKYGFNIKPGDAETLEIADAFAGSRSIGINNDWIRIDKERLLIKYAIDPIKESISKVDESEMPEQGCNVELTKIRANFQAAHYTFALEAFGKGVDLKKNLDLAVSEVFKNDTINGLSIANSWSYPEFLGNI